MCLQQKFGIKTAGLDEKCTAMQMLVVYAKDLKEGFADFAEPVRQPHTHTHTHFRTGGHFCIFKVLERVHFFRTFQDVCVFFRTRTFRDICNYDNISGCACCFSGCSDHGAPSEVLFSRAGPSCGSRDSASPPGVCAGQRSVPSPAHSQNLSCVYTRFIDGAYMKEVPAFSNVWLFLLNSKATCDS